MSVRIPASAGAKPQSKPVTAVKPRAAANIGHRTAISSRRGSESGRATAAARTSMLCKRNADRSADRTQQKTLGQQLFQEDPSRRSQC